MLYFIDIHIICILSEAINQYRLQMIKIFQYFINVIAGYRYSKHFYRALIEINKYFIVSLSAQGLVYTPMLTVISIHVLVLNCHRRRRCRCRCRRLSSIVVGTQAWLRPDKRLN